MLIQLRGLLSDKKNLTCSICRQHISPIQEGTSCPSCQTWFHFTHFSEAVKVFGCCPICKSKVRIKQRQKGDSISQVAKMRGYYSAMPLTTVLSLKKIGWKNNTFQDYIMLGEIVQIFHDEMSPRQYRYRKVIIRDETTSVTLQVWGITRMRQLDNCENGDILVIRNPKRPYAYHEHLDIDLWVHENFTSLEILKQTS